MNINNLFSTIQMWWRRHTIATGGVVLGMLWMVPNVLVNLLPKAALLPGLLFMGAMVLASMIQFKARLALNESIALIGGFQSSCRYYFAIAAALVLLFAAAVALQYHDSSIFAAGVLVLGIGAWAGTFSVMPASRLNNSLVAAAVVCLIFIRWNGVGVHNQITPMLIILGVLIGGVLALRSAPLPFRPWGYGDFAQQAAVGRTAKYTRPLWRVLRRPTLACVFGLCVVLYFLSFVRLGQPIEHIDIVTFWLICIYAPFSLAIYLPIEPGEHVTAWMTGMTRGDLFRRHRAEKFVVVFGFASGIVLGICALYWNKQSSLTATVELLASSFVSCLSAFAMSLLPRTRGDMFRKVPPRFKFAYPVALLLCVIVWFIQPWTHDFYTWGLPMVLCLYAATSIWLISESHETWQHTEL